jgi:hypothetical protein
MPFSTQRAVSDGTLQDLLIEIEYVDKEDINVYIADVLQVLDVGYSWISNSLLRFTVPVPDTLEVLLQRSTQLNDVLNIFTLGATFDNPTMDENFRQMLYIAQEAREGSTLEDVFTDLDMHGYRLQNLGAGTEPGDGINYEQYLDDALGTLAARNAAIASATTALAASNSATTSASTATTQAGISTSSAASATSSATSATNSASTATLQATAAAASAAAAALSETAAELAETNAEAWAASVNLPSAAGNANRVLRQNAGATGLEYGPTVQTSATDTTAGALLTVGAFGLGVGSTGAPVDLNTVSTIGFLPQEGTESQAAGFNWPSTGLVGTTPVSFTVRTEGVFGNGSNSRMSQVATECFNTVPGVRTWTRTKHDATWTVWVEVVTGTKQTSAADATAGRLLLVGANAQAVLTNLPLGVGQGQTWQYVARNEGTTYTNSTGKPIVFQVTYVGSVAGQRPVFTVGGAGGLYPSGGVGNNGTYAGGSILIPTGATYSWANAGGGTVLAVNAQELR